MERALGTTDLQAQSVVEACVTYWESKGLIERLRHAGIDYLAFIHKTCGEYAAALHLSEMESDDARKAIREVLANPDWDEILDFATSTSLATTVAETLVAELGASDPDESALNRLFRVLVRAETALSPIERRSFLEQVFAFARSEDRQKAYTVGRCLTEHDLSRFPEAETMAWDLVSAPADWSRLVGWAVIVRDFPGRVERGVLEDILADFLERSSAEDFFVLRMWKPPFGPLPDRGVFENFVVGALRLLLAECDARYQDRLLADVRQSQSNATMGFTMRLDELLKELGREDLFDARIRDKGVRGSLDFSVPAEFEQGAAALMSDVVPSAFLASTASPRPRTGAKFLAAFFEMAGILHTTASDVYVWTLGRRRLGAVHALLRAGAAVYGLPAGRLGAEAQEIIAAVESLRRKDGRQSFLSVLPSVDASEIDWRRVRDVEIGTDLLERLVHHPSRWVQHLAAVLLHERLEGVELSKVCATAPSPARAWTG